MVCHLAEKSRSKCTPAILQIHERQPRRNTSRGGEKGHRQSHTRENTGTHLRTPTAMSVSIVIPSYTKTDFSGSLLNNPDVGIPPLRAPCSGCQPSAVALLATTLHTLFRLPNELGTSAGWTILAAKLFFCQSLEYDDVCPL